MGLALLYLVVNPFDDGNRIFLEPSTDVTRSGDSELDFQDRWLKEKGAPGH